MTAPICQGMNSRSPKPSASLRLRLPDAVSRISRKMLAPISSTLAPPSRISPQFTSMSSSMRRYMTVLVASFSDGTGLWPNTEPRPVVKQMTLAPLATWPVIEHGS